MEVVNSVLPAEVQAGRKSIEPYLAIATRFIQDLTYTPDTRALSTNRQIDIATCASRFTVTEHDTPLPISNASNKELYGQH